MNEYKFEAELIEYLTNVPSVSNSRVEDKKTDYTARTQLWKYEPGIRTNEQLWDNFKEIIERHNKNLLDGPLSTTEFNQVKKTISGLHTPYEAGQFLYGTNGVSQVEIDLDNGRHVFLTVFKQNQVGAGETVYQVVNQIERPAVLAGRMKRRFDTTLLINGLPIIQIEEKRDTHDVNEALNQMKQYIDEAQYTGIFSTLQILVGITPNNVKYMANTPAESFNTNFAFNWQRRSDNKKVRDWKEFADSFLSIPMAHQMATNYMILDGTKNQTALKVMRPYQVYATQKVIDGLKHVDYDSGVNKVGYIWHTTGSGKTITSFKTAWLASRMPNVDKVVFVVDRIALTKQTGEFYRAYDPDAKGDFEGVVASTRNTTDLSRKLRSKGKDIVVTSVQKLDTLIKRKSFKSPDKNIVFIVDEAHRSTGGDSFEIIQKAFKHSAWVGYTGTPMFDDAATGKRTEDIFGPLLHAYTIREAISDANVLGFKVDFETTINEKEMKEKYLPQFYKNEHPRWSEKEIQNKIDHLTQDDMDDAVSSSFYDENPRHVAEVVKDVFENWRNRSDEGRYNALFTTHVGGGSASTPMAMMYYDEFQRVNEVNRQQGKPTLKTAVTFAWNSANDKHMLKTNQGLRRAMTQYNQEFGTNFNDDDTAAYTQDVVSRLNKTASDKRYLDLVIVVDQLLTGFDAPELNTLYVDRTLKGAALIQAYSRTNRIVDRDHKPWGRIVNYRWPAYNEKLMNAALSVYANRDSANLTEQEIAVQNTIDEIIAPVFGDVLSSVKGTVNELAELTAGFTEVPPSEKEQEHMMVLLRKYNQGVAKLKQFDYDSATKEGFDYDNPDALTKALGMTPEQEVSLTTVLTNELKEKIAKAKHISIDLVDLSMTHVKEVPVNYDYLTALIERLLNEVHEEKTEGAKTTTEEIEKFAYGLEDRHYAKRILKAVRAILSGHFPPKESDFTYPAQLKNSDSIIEQANTEDIDRTILDFRVEWGIVDIISSVDMRAWFSAHRYGQKDLDDTGQMRDVIADASVAYKNLAHNEKVQTLPKIKYRNGLRDAIYLLADELAEG